MSDFDRHRGQIESAEDVQFSEDDSGQSHVSFEDLFDLEEIQRLQDEFADAAGVASIITLPDGTPLTRPSNFCRLCIDLIRGSAAGLGNCMRSDAEIGKNNPDGPNVAHCMSGGLWDAGAGITVGGVHVANWLVGQVRDDSLDLDAIRAYAREIGIDEDEAAEAFLEVPSMSLAQFERIARMLFTLSKQLSDAAYRNLQQAKEIESRKRAEQALRESGELYRTIIDTSADGFWLVGPDATILQVNDAYCQMSGYAAEELLGMRLNDLDASEQAEEADAHRQRVLREGHDRFVTTHRRRDGSVYHVEVSVQSLGDHLVAFVRDISEQLRDQRLLEVSEARMRLASQAARLGAWTWNIGTGEVTWSDEMWALNGVDRSVSPSFAIWQESMHPDDVEAATATALAAVEADADIEIEYRLRNFEAEPRWFMSRGRKSQEPGGELGHYNGVVIDITPLKMAQHEVQELTQRLRVLSARSRKENEIQRRQLAEDLHDRVSQNLAVAKMSLQLVRRDCGLEDFDQAITLLSDALAEARAITTELSPAILHELGLSAALDWLSNHSERYGITTQVTVSDSLEDVDSDTAMLIFRCTRELIANAAKHAGVDRCVASWEDLGDWCRITVSDDGSGFDPDHERVPSSDDGGFGLFSIRERLVEIGGSLTVSSSPDAGTCMVLMVPKLARAEVAYRSPE